MDPKTVTIIGAGNGGFAMAADLTLSGWNIQLFELLRFKENITPLLKEGGIHITGAANTGFAKLGKITSDIKEAVENASCLMVNMVSLAHEEIAELLAPVVREDQTLFVLPGNAGSLVFTKVFREKGTKIKAPIAEVLTLPYGCRKTSPMSVNVSRLLGKIPLAAFPARDNKKVLTLFQQFYPKTFLMNNVLEVAINNPNIVLHPAPSMLNMARIEHSKGDFGLYQEGFSASVMKVMEGLDREMMAVQKGLGLPIRSYKQLFEERYEKSFDEQFGFMRKAGNRGPFDVKTRYITEDVPVGMVLIASLGRWLGVPTPTFDATIQFCGLMNETDYWKEGRTLERLGLATMNPDQLRRYLSEGEL
ncbi:MAG: NAD/NADP octopine/nopaline dehydrogenase family protein [Thermodesulfobacteriota bacterium]|nr:NAD/NADP octopine/nopaline dehydrogenase family protein [Thermodesulfobacteriota bacterium]